MFICVNFLLSFYIEADLFLLKTKFLVVYFKRFIANAYSWFHKATLARRGVANAIQCASYVFTFLYIYTKCFNVFGFIKLGITLLLSKGVQSTDTCNFLWMQTFSSLHTRVITQSCHLARLLVISYIKSLSLSTIPYLRARKSRKVQRNIRSDTKALPKCFERLCMRAVSSYAKRFPWISM